MSEKTVNGANASDSTKSPASSIPNSDSEKALSESSALLCPPGPGWKRFIIAWLSCLGLVIILAMRCEMGLAIIAMTAVNVKQIPSQLNSTVMQKLTFREINWSHRMIGIVEASFFIGYMLFSIPGGYLATIFPSNRVFGFAALTTCSFNLIVPIAAHINSGFSATLVVRIIQGMAEGCIYPSVHALWRHWAPFLERSKLVTISFFGMALGPIVGLPVCGLISDTIGWQFSFYIFGGLGIVWSIVWFACVSETPATDRFITEAERAYIESSLSPGSLRDVSACDVPWCKIFTSVPVYAIVVANFGRNWSFQFATSGLPEYFEDRYKLSAEETGTLLSMPYIIMAFLTPLGGQTADCIRRKKWLSTCHTRKMYNTVGFGITAICMAILAFCTTEASAAAMLTIGLGALGLGISGFGVNHLDIAPAYAGLLMGISNGIGTLSGIMSPIMAASITHHKTAHEWRTVFLIASGVHVVTLLFFLAFADGEEQAWSKPDARGAAAEAAAASTADTSTTDNNQATDESDAVDKDGGKAPLLAATAATPAATAEYGAMADTSDTSDKAAQRSNRLEDD